MPDDVLRVGASFDVSPITANINLAADTVETATARMNTSFSRVGPAWEEATHEMAFSTRAAREAVRGLGEEIGVKMPRFVSSFVADLGGIGPALAMAFTPIAIIGLVSVLSEIPEAIDKGINKLQGWDEAAKKAFSEATADAIKFEHETIKLNEEIAKIGLIGKTGVEKFDLEMAIAVDTTAQLKDLQKSYNDQLERAKSGMKFLEEETGTAALAGKALFDGYSALGGLSLKLGGSGQAIEKDKIDIDHLTNSMKQLSAEIAHRESVEKPTIDAEKNQAAIEAAKKYQEVLERTYTEETKRTQEGAAKELAAMERVRAEREKNEEEIARATQESAKKDLENFDRGLTEKNKMIEEQGRNELEQIRANTAMQEKATAATSPRGGADVAIKSEAFAGYQQEVAIIQQMIGVEEELRQKFIAAGLAQSDPKIIASEERQQGLVQQLQIAWQQYEKTVESVSQATYKAMSKSFQQVTGDFNKGFISWMNGSETFGRAMQKVWTGIADTAAETVLTMTEKWAEGILLHKALSLIEKQTNASTAASGAYASQAAIPVVGPELGAAAAAAAFTAVMAFERGGIVPRTDIAQVHKGEMVLPAHISQSVQRMAESGQGGGGHTFNYNPTVHGSSAAGIKDMLDQHGKQFVDYAVREMRRKNLG